MRLYTSITTVSEGLWIGCRCSSSTTMTSMGVWSIWATASGRSAPGKLALDGLVSFRRSFLSLALFKSDSVGQCQYSSPDSVWCGFVLDFLLKALQVNFFSHRRHGGFLRFKIDTLDGGGDDLFDLARKMAGASIGTPLSEENG